MATRSNRFFNNPQFAQVASNISGMFAPPSPGDELAYAKARSESQQAQRMRDLWEMADGDFDRSNIAAGNYNPSQSYYAVDTADSTARRGQDVTAATSRANNLEDNRYDLAGSIATQTVGEGERALGTSVLDDDIAQAAGLAPGMSIEGRDAPLSTDQVRAGAMQNVIAENPAFGNDLAYDEIDVTEVVGRDGEPRFAPTGRAGQLGLPAYSDPGGRAASQLYQWYDPATDTTGTATFDPNTREFAPAAGSDVMPPTAQIFEPGEPVGTSEELGIGKPGQNVIDRNIMQIDQTVGTIDTLAKLIGDNQASQGLVGNFRSAMQNLGQTGNELASYFGGEVERINNDIREGNLPADLAESFDPSLSAIDVMSNVLAFQYAKVLNEDRLSNEMLQQARRALNLEGMLANQADSLTRLNTIRDTLMAERNGLLAKKGGGLQAGAPPDQGPVPVGGRGLSDEERRFLGYE